MAVPEYLTEQHARWVDMAAEEGAPREIFAALDALTDELRLEAVAGHGLKAMGCTSSNGWAKLEAIEREIAFWLGSPVWL